MKKPKLHHRGYNLDYFLSNWEPVEPDIPALVKVRNKTRMERFIAWLKGWELVWTTK